ncbi:MBL fold metallo-hydrolase [Leptospira idonii]|nr:MBL fold metallo-hydrolase [Leptospira idonii]
MTKPHHTKSGYKNLNPDFKDHGFTDLLKWVSGRFRNEHSIDPEDYPGAFPVLDNSGEELRKNQTKLSVTWVGHATALIQIDGVNILTDPIWSERCSPVSFAGPKRYTPPGIKMENLPKIHLVLISHNHYDHMDLSSLQELEKRFQPKFLVGLGNKEFLLNEGLKDVEEMDWWDETKISGIQIAFTPTQHFSGRGLTDKFQTLWGSFVVSGKKEKVYFAGDTAYYTHFREIGAKFKDIDVAILPVGAFEPRWFMSSVHVDPAQSVQSFADLNAKYMIPIHYGTFVLSDEKLDSVIPETKSAFRDLNIDLKRLIDLKIGESRFF